MRNRVDISEGHKPTARRYCAPAIYVPSSAAPPPRDVTLRTSDCKEGVVVVKM